MKRLIKKYLGEIMITVGSGLFVYNVFSFSYTTFNKWAGGFQIAGTKREVGALYYYHNHTLLLLAFGTMLIIAGILIIRSKKHE